MTAAPLQDAAHAPLARLCRCWRLVRTARGKDPSKRPREAAPGLQGTVLPAGLLSALPARRKDLGRPAGPAPLLSLMDAQPLQQQQHTPCCQLDTPRKLAGQLASHPPPALPADCLHHRLLCALGTCPDWGKGHVRLP